MWDVRGRDRPGPRSKHPTAYEMGAIRAVEAYGNRVLQNAACGSAQVRTLAHWTVMHFHKRALSSPEALRCSLRNRLEQRETGFSEKPGF